MRSFFAAALLLASTGALAQPGPPPHGKRDSVGKDSVFLSPMGEPFRRSADGLDGADLWFAQADSNHDRGLTLDEMQKDAARFFATLDVNHDGEIDPPELSRYETDIAPAYLRMAAGLRPVPNAPRIAGESGAGPGGGLPDDPEDGGRPRMSLQGVPEPVAMADTNLNRGVSADEFASAATKRFYTLDRNRDGKITLDELRPAQPTATR